MNSNLNNSKTFDDVFSNEIIKAGRWTLLLAIPLCFIPPIYLWVRYGAVPEIKTILTGWFLIASVYGVEYIVTPISYYPILGNAGTYMAFLSGNIANVRVPCAVVAQDVIGVKAGTPEGEVVATLGMAGSIITNAIVVAIAAFAGKTLFNYFPPIVIEALAYVLPAIFGALFALFAVKYPKYGIFAISIAGVLLGIVKVIPTFLLVPTCVFSTIAFAYFTYKKETSDK